MCKLLCVRCCQYADFKIACPRNVLRIDICQLPLPLPAKLLSNPDTPVSRADFNPPFGLGIHPPAEKLATGKNQRVLLAAFANG